MDAVSAGKMGTLLGTARPVEGVVVEILSVEIVGRKDIWLMTVPNLKYVADVGKKGIW